jgi:hypothetical protein
MHSRHAMNALFLGTALFHAGALHAQIDDAQKAMASIVGLDISSADIVEWCSSRAPASAAPLRSAWQAWRSANAVEDVTRGVNPELLRRTRNGMASVIAATREKLSRAGEPVTVCPGLRSMWSSAEFDARRTYAAAYTPAPATAETPRATTAAARNTSPPSGATSREAPQPREAFDATNYAATARPTGTVYTVAQMTALRKEWVGTPYNFRQGRQAARAAGTLYISGTVVQRGERFYLQSTDGAFASSISVAAGIPISAFLGQEITLQGTLDDLPSSLIFLRAPRVVRDPSALRPSTLPSAPGMQRTRVPVEQITTTPGNGAHSRDLVGMHYHWSSGTGVNGYEFREEIRLLFRDGTAYLRTDVPPSDLDVAASRRLEPQNWARWRRAGNDFEFQKRDDYGQPEGDWFKKSGRLAAAWNPNQRLTGTYSSAAFYGSIALGGTYSTNSYSFTPDGRWERVGFSRSSSGSMAAQEPVGYSGSASSVSDGSGTKSSAGAGNAGVYTRSSSQRDDGAKNRGTYRFDGMTLELKADDGTVRRVISMPMDAALKSIFLFGKSYSRK